MKKHEMTGYVVTTNNRPRELLGWSDLTAKERKQMDWAERSANDFFRYQGYIYSCTQFTNIQGPKGDPGYWQGSCGESLTTGVLVRMVDDLIEGRKVIVGSFRSKTGL